jgi:hypothetical protein
MISEVRRIRGNAGGGVYEEAITAAHAAAIVAANNEP